MRALFSRKTSLKRLVVTTSITALCIATNLGNSSTSVSASAANTNAGTRYFYATGLSISGVFLSFFDRYGGVDTFGYPISNQIVENGRPVQYFERQRFEYHSEAAGTPYEVQLTRLGAEMSRGKSALSPVRPFIFSADRIYIQETGHSLSSPFLGYWRANGDVRLFGYPISEPVTENRHAVQYFERVRMEYHPEIADSRYRIELGLLGKEYMQVRGVPVAANPALDTRNMSPVSGGAQVASPTSASALASVALSGKEITLMQLINKARTSAGAQPVSVDGAIRGVALYRSRDMAARNYFSHTTPEGRDFLAMLRSGGISYQYAGEIIHTNNYGDGQAAAQAFNGYMGSPTHRQILMDPRYDLAGVGEATDSRGLHYFTVIFVQR